MALLISAVCMPVLAASPSHAKPPAVAAACIACHGSGSTVAQLAYPKLDGQHTDYIIHQIFDFQAGRRKDPVMSPIARELDQHSLNTIAAYFSEQPVIRIEAPLTQTTERGHGLYVKKHCYLCHHTEKQREASVLPRGPVIAGQYRNYLLKAMTDIKLNKRPSDVYDLMHSSFGEVSKSDIEAMADYISTHTPAELQSSK